MLSVEEKKQLSKQLDKLKKEVIGLKVNLNQIDEQKESAFQEKEKITQDISKLIKGVKTAKQKRNALTKEVKTLKQKRDELNKQVVSKISEIKSLDKERKEIAQKYNIKEDPSHIKEKIEQLEEKIETNVMSFDKEKKLMKIIKDLKKKYNEANVISNVWEKLNALSKEVSALKKESQNVHEIIQTKAKESQANHEEMLKLSKDIDELKVKEEAAYKNFFEQKQKFNEVNTALKEKLLELNKLSEKLSELKVKSQQERKKRQDDLLKDMETLVEDKIKAGKKLTTEDLLVLQKAGNLKN